MLFEKKHIAGGLNTLGIAPYKQSGAAALKEIEHVFALGDVQLKTGVEVVARAAEGGRPARPIRKPPQ